MTEHEYIDYFEGLARKNSYINHTDKQERFFYNDDDNLSALREMMKNKLHYPALILDAYTETVLSEQDNPRLKVMGGFSIVCRADGRDRQAQRIGRQHAQAIGRTILARLRHDCLRPTGSLVWRKIRPDLNFEGGATPLLEGTIGWAYSIELLMPVSIAVESSDWNDLK